MAPAFSVKEIEDEAAAIEGLRGEKRQGNVYLAKWESGWSRRVSQADSTASLPRMGWSKLLHV